ncbi:MAG: DinB family protein [Bacteroidota bacterium]
MNSIFDNTVIDAFKTRINKLDESSEAKWGKMNVKQMLRHCIENERMLLREKVFKPVFIGKIFGKMALKSDIKDDRPFGKNSPTHPDLRIKEVHEPFDALIAEWITLLDKYPSIEPSHYSDFRHPFFQKMDASQVGKFAFKHVDHHLRQFGV